MNAARPWVRGRRVLSGYPAAVPHGGESNSPGLRGEHGTRLLPEPLHCRPRSNQVKRGRRDRVPTEPARHRRRSSGSAGRRIALKPSTGLAFDIAGGQITGISAIGNPNSSRTSGRSPITDRHRGRRDERPRYCASSRATVRGLAPWRHSCSHPQGSGAAAPGPGVCGRDVAGVCRLPSVVLHSATLPISPLRVAVEDWWPGLSGTKDDLLPRRLEEQLLSSIRVPGSPENPTSAQLARAPSPPGRSTVSERRAPPGARVASSAAYTVWSTRGGRC